MDRLEIVERVEHILEHSCALQGAGYTAEQVLHEMRMQLTLLVDGGGSE